MKQITVSKHPSFKILIWHYTNRKFILWSLNVVWDWGHMIMMVRFLHYFGPCGEIPVLNTSWINAKTTSYRQKRQRSTCTRKFRRFLMDPRGIWTKLGKGYNPHAANRNASLLYVIADKSSRTYCDVYNSIIYSNSD